MLLSPLLEERRAGEDLLRAPAQEARGGGGGEEGEGAADEEVEARSSERRRAEVDDDDDDDAAADAAAAAAADPVSFPIGASAAAINTIDSAGCCGPKVGLRPGIDVAAWPVTQ